MIRSAWLLLFLAIAQTAHGQADPLASLRQTADKTAADWAALATGLEQKIETLLPCDPKSRAAVEEVSRASDVRLSALSTYLKAAAAAAKTDTDAAKRVLAAQAALSGGWNTESADADQERASIESQVSDLKESMRKRGSLAGAEKVLTEIAVMVKDRAAKSAELASRKDPINAMLGELVVAYRNRQTALESESALLDAETAKWKAYYAARVSRAITECTIINPVVVPRKKQP
jgi:hypothetical protein